jgi:hypothetical protein
MVATAYQHGAGSHDGTRLSGTVRRKPVKAGQSRCPRRERHETKARFVKTFQNDGDVTMDSAEL